MSSAESTENYLRDINDTKGIQDCYDEYGDILISEGCDEKLDFADPSTYDLASKYLNRFGMISNNALMTKMLNRNRLHPNVRKAYSTVYRLKESELVPQYDRIGWIRSNSSYKYTTPTNIHLDINPVYYFDEAKYKNVISWINEIKYDSLYDLITENNAKNIKMGRQCQGVLNLINNDKDDGGFQFIPGGHKYLKDWYNSIENKQGKFGNGKPNGRYIFNEKDKFPGYPVRLPCPAGTLIIFDVAMPHGTKSNMSDENRMAQFLRYMPKNAFTEKTYTRRQKLIDKNCVDK
jgi:ectoine hydroxylase-related dioxygenase (phytanoyl-CoA dioxygenase family)